jgi:hypothetical protein
MKKEAEQTADKKKWLFAYLFHIPYYMESTPRTCVYPQIAFFFTNLQLLALAAISFVHMLVEASNGGLLPRRFHMWRHVRQSTARQSRQHTSM